MLTKSDKAKTRSLLLWLPHLKKEGSQTLKKEGGQTPKKEGESGLCLQSTQQQN